MGGKEKRRRESRKKRDRKQDGKTWEKYSAAIQGAQREGLARSLLCALLPARARHDDGAKHFPANATGMRRRRLCDGQEDDEKDVCWDAAFDHCGGGRRTPTDSMLPLE